MPTASSSAALAALALAALAGPTAAQPAEAIARGAALYAAHCAACHGAALEGQPDWQAQNPDGTYPAPPHDASGHSWHHGDAFLAAYIALGGAGAMGEIKGFRSTMPAFGEVLGADDIAAVLAFLKSRWPSRERAYQAQATAAGG